MADKEKKAASVRKVLLGMQPDDLEHHARRITREDLAKVTPQQVEDAMAVLTKEQLRSLLKAVSDNVTDVMDSTTDDSFAAAVHGMRDEHLVEASRHLQKNQTLQGQLLSTLTEQKRKVCIDQLAQKQQPPPVTFT